VGVKVENVRVGKMTNWDKLILDVTTDGTVEPEDAFKESVNILINQFNALIGKNDTESEEVKEAEGEEEDK
jgi:DNA-directed RNA polymerase subunit alpha